MLRYWRYNEKSKTMVFTKMLPQINPTVYDLLSYEEKISLHIFIAREKAGISREDLAKSLNIAVTVLRNIETMFHEKTRRKSISCGELDEIAKALGCPVSRLLPRED
jgi:DNA-binding Xre family transcriptional regulator